MQESDWLRTGRLEAFGEVPLLMKRSLWRFLADHDGVVGYGAAAKASTVLSYCGIGPESLRYIADTTPTKQGRFIGGSQIPIVPPDRLQEDRPETIWILPFNHAPEIVERLRRECAWGPTLTWQDGIEMVSA